MQQTTYGEIRKKTKISSRKVIDDFLEKEEIAYSNILKYKNCLYEDNYIISDPSLNYLNLKANTNLDLQLKSVLYKEYLACEKIYPYLGDVLFSSYFSNQKIKSSDNFVFTRKTYNSFIDSLVYDENKKLFEWIVENTSMDYTIDIKESVLSDVIVEKSNNVNLLFEYDSSFLGGKSFHTMKDYKFVIIDGYIESIGEIHHLLDQAYRTKIPHVIFCFGMSSEVDHVIKYNNTHSKFEVFPVVIKFNEETINILNDIAVLHNSHVVSSKTGQTISQAVREDLPTGKEITFNRTGFQIKPIASEQQLQLHRKFLKDRISTSSNNENSKYLLKRMKSFTSKSIKIFIPKNLNDNTGFLREVDYIFRFLSFINNPYKIVKINESKKNYFIPGPFLTFVEEKVKSINNIFESIDKVITYAGY